MTASETALVPFPLYRSLPMSRLRLFLVRNTPPVLSVWDVLRAQVARDQRPSPPRPIEELDYDEALAIAQSPAPRLARIKYESAGRGL